MNRGRGFTLLELVVAIAVFAVMALAAYQGLDSVLLTRAHVAEAGDRLGELQMGMFRIERDLEQATSRPVRDDHGQGEAALVAAPGGRIALAFTRDGWENPLAQPRAGLQRVAYRLEDGTLFRTHWVRLDRGTHLPPRDTALVGGVRGLEIRLLAASGNWETHWPPPGDTPDENIALLPRAIELTLDLVDLGPVTRLLLLAENP